MDIARNDDFVCWVGWITAELNWLNFMHINWLNEAAIRAVLARPV